LFAKNGYSVALIARGANEVNKIADEINAAGGHVSYTSSSPSYFYHYLFQAAPFPVPSYSDDHIASAWDAIHAKFPKPEYTIRVALFNVAHGVWKPFLDITPQDVQDCLQTSVAAAFSFARGAILAFKDNEIEQPNGKRGALIFTGATASARGNVVTSAFAAGKFGTRALSQSLAKEFGKQNIHVAHVRLYQFLVSRWLTRLTLHYF
jgi:NAD(P)-dependent dehydrogenase (short-subunit alcohol dehydrogenase family)